MSHFLAILKNSKKNPKNIKLDIQLDFHMKNILTSRIDQSDHLNFEDKKNVRNTQTIRTTRSIVVKLIK
jgi:hypothetical protein